MRHFLILVTVILTIKVFGQDLEKQGASTDFKKIQIGINFSPDIDYRTLRNNDGSSSNNAIIKLRNGMETPKFGYTAGIKLNYNIKKFLGIEFGVQYSNKGYQQKTTNLTYNTYDPFSPTKAKYIYNDHYIDIPLGINYFIGKNKVRFVASTGLTANIFLLETQENIYTFSDNKTTKNRQKTHYSYNLVYLSFFVSAGIDYRINNKINCRVEPIFRYGITKVSNTPISSYLWNGGLNLSCYYSF